MHVLICEVRCQMETLNAIKRILTSTYALDILCIFQGHVGSFCQCVVFDKKPIAPRSSPGACRPFTDIPKRRLPGGRYFSTGLDTTCAQEESPTPLRCHKSNESDVNLFWLDNSQLCKIVIHVEIMHCCPPESVHHIFRNKNMNQTPHNRPPLHLN